MSVHASRLRLATRPYGEAEGRGEEGRGGEGEGKGEEGGNPRGLTSQLRLWNAEWRGEVGLA